MAASQLLLVQQLLQHPLLQAIQIQAALIMCIGCVGWTLAGIRRRRELLRLRAANQGAFLQCAGNRVSCPAAEPSTQCTQPAACRDSDQTSHKKLRSGREPRPGSFLQKQKHAVLATAAQQDAAGDLASTLHGQPSTPGIFKSRPNYSFSSSNMCWPPLAVVLPVKGCRPHSTDNWASQLAATYDGFCAFVFVMESAADPAVAAVAQLMQQTGAVCLQQQQGPNTSLAQQHKQHMQPLQQQQGALLMLPQQELAGVLAVWQQQQQQRGGRLVVVAQAGLASTCSQKIHNILHGIEVAKALLHHWQQQQQPASAAAHHYQEHHQQGGTAEAHLDDWVDQAQKQGQGPFIKSAHILAYAFAGSTDGASSSSGSGSRIGSGASSRAGSIISTIGSSVDDAVPPPDTLPTPAPATATAAAAAAGAAADVAAANAAGYVCVLDDDVLLHPLGLMQLVDELEDDQGLFMATGYPFDIVPEHSSSSSSSSLQRSWGRLLSYATASYHLPLTIGFSIADRGTFVWGGAMMMRAAALQQQPPLHLWKQQQSEPGGVPSLLQVWREGGYSDDLLVAAYCVENGLSIGLPASGLYPQLLPPTTTFKQYWNYLRRQLFVLDTYYSPSNRTTNHTMMLLHSYGSAVFAAAVATSLLQVLLAAAVAAAAGGGRLLGGVVGQQWAASPGRGSVGELVGALVGSVAQSCPQLHTNSSSSWGVASAAAAAAGASRGLVVFVVCVSAAQLSIWFMARQCLALMTLQAAAPPAIAAAAAAAAGAQASHGRGMIDQQPPTAVLTLADTPSSTPSQQQQQQHRRQRMPGDRTQLPPLSDRQLLLQGTRVSYPLLWAGWVLENAILPACMAYTFFYDWISWGGIHYHKAGGKVVHVVHPGRP